MGRDAREVRQCAEHLLVCVLVVLGDQVGDGGAIRAMLHGAFDRTEGLRPLTVLPPIPE